MSKTGFRADFYIGRGHGAVWIGSLKGDGAPMHVQSCLQRGYNPAFFMNDVVDYLYDSRGGILREMGWPWAYDDSSATDYAYALWRDKVWVSCYGSPWVALDRIDCTTLVDDYDFDKVRGPNPIFPSMSDLS